MRPLLDVLIEKSFGKITIEETTANLDGKGYRSTYIIQDTDEITIGYDVLLERAIEQAYDFVCVREKQAQAENE